MSYIMEMILLIFGLFIAGNNDNEKIWLTKYCA